MLIDALQHPSNVCNHLRGVNRQRLFTAALLIDAPEGPVMRSAPLTALANSFALPRHEANPQTTIYRFGLGVPRSTDRGEGAVAAGEETGEG